jgi:hypothetical protein
MIELKANETKNLNVALTPKRAVIAKTTIDSYEVWLVGIKPEALQDLQYHEFEPPISISVYFQVWKAPYDQEIWITDESQMPTATLKLTQPDGTVVVTSRKIPQINSPGEYNMSTSAVLEGLYRVDFCGITFSFRLVPVLNEIFTPTPIETIYDSAPYCQETYDLHKSVLEGEQDGYNLLAIANRAVNINITSLDLAIKRFFTGDAGRLAITIYGNVKNSPNWQYHISQAHIPLTIKLIPQELYAQAYLEKGDFTYSIRNPRYWNYPDPDSKTLFYPYSGISRYYDVGDPKSTTGMDIATGATGPFKRTAAGLWARGGSYLNRQVLDQTWVQKLLVAGDRYEVVITSGVGLDPYLEGYSYAAYPLKFWHVGYVIIS